MSDEAPEIPVQMTIWKYTMADPEGSFAMPHGAEIVHVAMQRANLCFWAKFEVGTPATSVRTFRVVATGEPFDAGTHQYVGTAVTNDGRHVWHLFEVLG